MKIEFKTNCREIELLIDEIIKTASSSFANQVLRKSLSLLASEIRKDVTASKASRRLKTSARKTVSYSLVTTKKSIAGKIVKVPTKAKVGFGVGKRTKQGARNRPGIGVSKQNIHWFVLGTAKRKTSKNQDRGWISPIFSGIVNRKISLLGKKIQDVMYLVNQRQIKSLVSKIVKKKVK